jgi:hypothetical protein
VGKNSSSWQNFDILAVELPHGTILLTCRYRWRKPESLLKQPVEPVALPVGKQDMTVEAAWNVIHTAIITLTQLIFTIFRGKLP